MRKEFENGEYLMTLSIWRQSRCTCWSVNFPKPKDEHENIILISHIGSHALAVPDNFLM